MGRNGRIVNQSGIVDSTGLEHRHTSNHYSRVIKHQRPDVRKTGWVKLSILTHGESHLIVSAVINRGPSADYAQFKSLLRESLPLMRFTRVLADRGYDSESNHRYARKNMGIPCCLIPVAQRRFKTSIFSGYYRSKMSKRFPKKAYRQRSQVESVFSSYKRLLGSSLTARNWVSRSHECLLRILTLNLMRLVGAQ